MKNWWKASCDPIRNPWADSEKDVVFTMNTRYMSKALAADARAEETKLPSGNFTARLGRGYAYGMVACAVFGTGMCLLFLFAVREPLIGWICAGLGFAALLLLPTYFTYRCYVDSAALKVEYYILCFKVKREIQWKEIRYRATKRDHSGNLWAVRFYNADKKKLVSFDSSVVGAERIARMAKRKRIEKIK